MAGTTTADFLKWERKAQMSFLQVSISMAATIAAQTQPKLANCINDWYYVKNELEQKRHNEIIKVMPQYKKFHPTTIVLAYIENVCGKFEKN